MTTPAYLFQVATLGTPPTLHACESHEDFGATLAALKNAHKVVLARIDVWQRLDCGQLHLVAVHVYTHDSVWETLVDPLRALLNLVSLVVERRAPEGDAPVSAPGGDA